MNLFIWFAFFVNRFRDEEGGSKQVWDGSKGMLSSFAVPNCFGP